MSTSPGRSFVYPVKSLLTGNILPAAQGEPPPPDRRSSRRRRKRNARGLEAARIPSPNFRHYPGGDAAAESSFATTPVPVLNPPSTPSTGDDGNLSDPDSLCFYTPTGSPSPESSPPHPPNFSEVTSDAFSSSAANLELYPPPQPGSPVNMSDTSIVHLPPPRSTSCPAHSSTPTPSGSRQHASDLHSTGYSSYSSSQHAQSNPQSLYGFPPSSRDDVGSSFAVDLGRPSSCSVSSGSDTHQTGRSGRSTGGYSSSDEPLVTFRFEHREDGDGHHVVIGREGKLSRCEDEPIRTPGAVQGFGVLIAVQGETDGGKLVVRQVSENSTELLGLSPHYLFSLTCFTEVLPDSQIENIWDNINYLADPDENSSSEDDSPHVFLLSGWGMPGSALLGDGGGDSQCRRAWSCWCAAHRPKMAGGNANNGIHDLIILELELEHDVFNPLYPTPRAQNVDPFSDLSSPGSSRSVGSTSTSGTFIPTTPTPQDSIPVATVSASISSSSLPKSSLTSMPMSSLTNQANAESLPGSEGDDDQMPSAGDILESTTNYAKPLLALERIRKLSHVAQPFSATHPLVGAFTAASEGSGSVSSTHTLRNQRRRKSGTVGMMDIFAVMSQINEQLGTASELDTFLKVVVGLVKDISQFHRVLVYQFDENWNGQTVAELVDWNHTHDLYRGLHFPASDIPAQARQLYVLNKLRLLYDREQATARLVARSKDVLDVPLNMTHCYLRAMSPIHLKYLANMGVRSSMSVSIVAFGRLWGLVACHSYGLNGMRIPFPVRQMLRLMSDSISRNVERISYAQRLHTRKMFNTMTIGGNKQPQGYIVSNASDLLELFDADFGMLVIGEGAKILGPNEHGQEVLVVAEYLRLKHFGTIQVSQAVMKDFPDMQLSTGLEVIAGLLYVPLSQNGTDFIVVLRKGQPRAVRWAGKPDKDGQRKSLEPRASFKVWSETVAGRCRVWTDEQLEMAGVLALVYGKFIEVWRGRERERERSLQTTKLTNILLANAGHEVRTPLNHIINCLELALNGKLDVETREILSKSHAASKSLLFTINDLLDLTRVESGRETTFSEPFHLPSVIIEATNLYKYEAQRKGLDFEVDLAGDLGMVVGDSSKVRTVVANLTANALKYTQRGTITVSCRACDEQEGLRNPKQVSVEIIVSDTGCGIPSNKLENIFREFEQVESAQPKTSTSPGLGLGLAVVARSVEQLGGQLRVDSKVDQGSRFSFLIPFTVWEQCGLHVVGQERTGAAVPHPSPSSSSLGADKSVEHEREMSDNRSVSPLSRQDLIQIVPATSDSQVTPTSETVEVGADSVDPKLRPSLRRTETVHPVDREGTASPRRSPVQRSETKLRILIVEDNDINRLILSKRLQSSGHAVVNTMNGKEGVEMIKEDQAFDCILMDVQMPILNGLEATQQIRHLEATKLAKTDRLAHSLNGGRIPIFAVSASLLERQREELEQIGIDGWILKPIDFRRLYTILRGVTDPVQRECDRYSVGSSWEIGGWLLRPSLVPAPIPALSTDYDGADRSTTATVEDSDRT